MCLRVGITGGIGSGKSTVARVFNTLGIPVYNADTAAKRLMNEDPAIRAALIQEFGENTYLHNELNRAYLADIVFKDPAKLTRLNAITHPATIQDAENWMLQHKDSPYTLKEAALIFESGSSEQLDLVIGVFAPETLRIHRVMTRDRISREAVKDRMKKQIEESIKMKLCDFVIVNDDTQLVIPQVLAIDEILRTRTASG